MKRSMDYFLLEWKKLGRRKPLLLRGARQVGKTHVVRTLGKTFKYFIEVNLEDDGLARQIFEKDFDGERIVSQLSELTRKKIEPEKTLLFLDEIQITPQAIIALRYFYEKMPDLHVIAAGSLLDFAIEEVGVPVGRISMLYMYPSHLWNFWWRPVLRNGHKQ